MSPSARSGASDRSGKTMCCQGLCRARCGAEAAARLQAQARALPTGALLVSHHEGDHCVWGPFPLVPYNCLTMKLTTAFGTARRRGFPRCTEKSRGVRLRNLGKRLQMFTTVGNRGKRNVRDPQRPRVGAQLR
eukprot:1369887-Pyramimonas_sp.AAC.4